MCVGLTNETMGVGYVGYDLFILGVLIKVFMYQFCHRKVC
jgi:hypothetical protein